MKIGITTFQRAHNFGAVMQMYALYNFLKNRGHDVWILDYHCPPVEDSYIKESFNIRRYIRKNIIQGFCQIFRDLYGHFTYHPQKVQRFTDFLNSNFQLTKRFDSAEDMPTDFDLLITGSDQLWNYNLTKGRREVYFLDNKKTVDDFPRRISYAVSLEGKYFQDLLRDNEYVKNILDKFDWVSVREKFTADFLRDNMGINADVTVDPSLFLTREDCLKIAVKPKEEHYLCVYRVNRTSYLNKLAKLIAKERNLKIVDVYAASRGTCKAESFGPREILGYICYADAVLTSSFHGTAFSIINGKDFYSAYDHHSIRVEQILNKMNLSDRFLTKIEDYQGFTEVNIDNGKRMKLANASKEMLLEHIKK